MTYGIYPPIHCTGMIGIMPLIGNRQCLFCRQDGRSKRLGRNEV